MIDTPCESNISTVVEEHVSSEITHFDIVVKYTPSVSSQQIIKQIKVIQ